MGRWYYNMLARTLAYHLDLNILWGAGDLPGCLLALSGQPEVQ
jgi:hypothetical protein